MNIEREIRSLIKDLEECDQPYEEIFYQIVRLVNERVGELLQEIDRLKKQDIDVIISYAVERQKLIECLRFYERLARGREINDGGRRARTLLAEIGVTVE